MHTITPWDQSVTILRRLECCCSVFCILNLQITDLFFLPLSLFSIQQPISNTLYIKYLYAQSVELALHPSKFLAAASRDSKTVLYTLYILPLVPLSLLIGAFQGEAETLETFVPLSGALLLASVALMMWILGRRLLRDGKSPLTSDILRRACYQRKSVQIERRQFYTEVGMAHGLS